MSGKGMDLAIRFAVLLARNDIAISFPATTEVRYVSATLASHDEYRLCFSTKVYTEGKA
jgi:hypothetical protein